MLVPFSTFSFLFSWEVGDHGRRTIGEGRGKKSFCAPPSPLSPITHCSQSRAALIVLARKRVFSFPF